MKDKFLAIVTVNGDGIPVTTSRVVADQFGKRHDHVVRDIERILKTFDDKEKSTTLKIEDSEDELDIPKIGDISSIDSELVEEYYETEKQFLAENFKLSHYTDSAGRKQAMYLMTKRGFTVLAMGFTGKESLRWKIAYSDAFERMEGIIRNGITSSNIQVHESAMKTLDAQAEEGQQAANNAVINSFLEALKIAFDSGGYYLDKKHAKKPEKPPHGIYLGYYDEFIITLKATEAYDIYERSTERPLNYKTLWDILSMAEVIKPRTTRPDRKRNFRGKQVASVQIYRDKAPMLKFD